MAADPFDRAAAAQLARRLVRTARDAALGTLGPGGAPHLSHVAAAGLADGAPVVLVSDLALHTRYLRCDDRASLLFVAGPGAGEGADTNTRARLTVAGRMVEAPDRTAARARFVRRHPDAAMYVDFADMHLMRLEPERAHLVAGFGRIVGLETGDIVAPPAAGFAEADESACAHMNADHRDALALMASVLAGAPAGDWRAVGVDPQGIDLCAGDRCVRVEFDAPLAEAGQLRGALKRLAERARASAAQTKRKM